LKEEELKTLHRLRQVSPRAETAYQLVATFLQMVRERTGEQLDAWLDEVKASKLEAFVSFTTSVQADKDAVVAGLTLPWSTGPLEGHVNRLKLIKRSMYGRAKFDLLRLRALHPTEKSRRRKLEGSINGRGVLETSWELGQTSSPLGRPPPHSMRLPEHSLKQPARRPERTNCSHPRGDRSLPIESHERLDGGGGQAVRIDCARRDVMRRARAQQ
jgi:hypothetical protein